MGGLRVEKRDGDSVSVGMLADFPELIEQVGRLRWSEWGKPSEPTDLEFWIDVSRREAGRDKIPITWVALNAQRQALGAVGLGEFDPDEFQDRSPWLVGMVVAPDRRRDGIGARLVAKLEAWAATQGFRSVWVATGPPGGPAVRFYESCGWETVDLFRTSGGEEAVVLERRLDA